MKNVANTIEDLLEILAGLQGQAKIQIESSDVNIMHSIARQVFKGTALTDRQFALMKEKLNTYKDQFTALEYDFDRAVESLRLPLRQLDRSRYINIIKDTNGEHKIAVRFIFQKKLISALEEIKKRIKEESLYDKVNKIHYFDYSEHTLYSLVEIFKEKNFELDDLTKEIYEKISNFNKEDYVPGVYNYQLKNLKPRAFDYLVNELGDPSQENLLLYKDRSLLHGLDEFDQHELDKTSTNFSILAKNIANRKNCRIKVLSTKYNFDALISSLIELDRFPVLFVIPNDKAHDKIVTAQQHLHNIIPSEEVCVMFRMDNHGEGLEFNHYIKKENLNNKLDTNTKVVYNLDNKVPKPLMNSEWEPKSIVILGHNSIPNVRKVLECFNSKDLIIFYEDSESPSTRFFFDTKLETI